MKTKLLLFYFLFAGILCHAQIVISDPDGEGCDFVIGNPDTTPNSCSLISNGGFEVATSLPTDQGQIIKACNWFSPNGGTPDFYHSSAAAPYDTVNNFPGPQVPFGNAYAGMIIHTGVITEPITTKLTSSLQANTSYQLTFSVSKSELSAPNNAVQFQAYFSATMPFTTSNGELPIDPSGILLENTEFSTNTTGWDTITLEFTTGSTNYLEFLSLGGISEVNSINDPKIYYYIDNVSLIPLTNENNLNLPSIDCNNSVINNLSSYLSTGTPSGSFSGNGVSGNTFDASVAGVGSHTITYTYTNPLGCQTTITDILAVPDVSCIDPTECDCEETAAQIFVEETSTCGLYIVHHPDISNCPNLMPMQIKGYDALDPSNYPNATVTYGTTQSTVLFPNSGEFYIGTIYNINGDKCGLTRTDLNVNSCFSDDIIIYPNPTKTSIKVNMKNVSLGNNKVILMDYIGNTLEEKPYINDTIIFDLSKRPSGVYFVTFIDAKKGKISKTIIKE